MEKHIEEIQELRELERIALNDVKQVNNIVKLQKVIYHPTKFNPSLKE